MKTIFQWLYSLFFLFGLLAETTAYAPAATPDLYESAPILTVDLTDKLYLKKEAILRYGRELKFFDPHLLVAVAQVESSFRPKITSNHKGVTYYGLMQMSYGTAQMLGFQGKPSELLNWKTNVKYAVKYLKHLKEEHGNTPHAIAAYNAGTVYPCKKCAKPGQVVNQSYVDDVLEAYKESREI